MDAAVDEQQIATLLKGVDIPPRPAILVANTCGWGDAAAATAQLRAAVQGPLWLLEPAAPDCDAAAIAASAERAAA